MKSWMPGLFPARTPKRIRPAVSIFRPRLEALEERLTPTIGYHGGAILASVQAQSVYLGAGWQGASVAGQTGRFDQFLGTLVNGTATAPSSYLALLHNAGYSGVTGAGDALSGVIDSTDLAAASTTRTVYDSQIESFLATQIAAGALQQPNANTLYVVYAEPNVVVSFPNGQNSVNTFLAYHSSFSDGASLVRYAVVPYHGTGGNAQDPWLTSAFDSMTVAASHETAEAVTDPDGTAWFDQYGNEVGDVVNGSTVYVANATKTAQYAVQREGSKPASLFNFLPMTPAGETASHMDVFGGVGGALTVNGAAVANPSGETGTVRAVSAPSVDDFGQPMTDVVFSDGKAYEYHDFPAGNPTATANPSFFPWTSLGSNVKQAASGQAVSYVLFTNGNLEEYVDPNYSTYYYGFGVNPGSRRGVIASGVTGITTAGLDTLGVNAVVYTKTVNGATTFFEWRDVTGSSSQVSGSSPTGGIHHSEAPGAFGSSGASATSQTADLVFLNASSGASAGFASPAPQAAAPTFAPAPIHTDVSAPQASVHTVLPDGGAGGGEFILPQAPSTGPATVDSSATPSALADLPLLGPLFTEAVRRLQEARFAVPVEMWQAAPVPPPPRKLPRTASRRRRPKARAAPTSRGPSWARTPCRSRSAYAARASSTRRAGGRIGCSNGPTKKPSSQTTRGCAGALL